MNFYSQELDFPAALGSLPKPDNTCRTAIIKHVAAPAIKTLEPDPVRPPDNDFFRPTPDGIIEKHPVTMTRAQYDLVFGRPPLHEDPRYPARVELSFTEGDTLVLEESFALEEKIKKLPVLSVDTKPISLVRKAVARIAAEAKLSDVTQTGPIKKVVGKIITSALVVDESEAA